MVEEKRAIELCGEWPSLCDKGRESCGGCVVCVGGAVVRTTYSMGIVASIRPEEEPVLYGTQPAKRPQRLKPFQGVYPSRAS